MTQQNTLEFKGTLNAYPLGELFVEIGQARLSGSLRLSRDAHRSVVYFNEGAAVYAVSNARQNRLFSKLIEKRKVDTARLAGNVDPVNDVELSAFLLREGLLTKDELDEAVVSQIEGVLIDVLSWPEGEWIFSPLARVRQDLHYRVELDRVLADYARCLPLSTVRSRFMSVEESFSVRIGAHDGLRLLAHEEDILRRFGDLQLSVQDIRNACAMPEDGLLQALYVLWLGGKIERHNWNAAFSPSAIAEIGSARLAPARKPTDAPAAEPEQKPATADRLVVPELAITLEEYLERVENAATHYEVLGVDQTAPVTAVKQAYFGMAKLFHPDRYHKEKQATVRRIQTAFTKLAHAHETLKTAEGRSAYDHKLRREAEAREKRMAAGQSAAETGDAQSENAYENFVQGKEALAAEDYGVAISSLSRAVHYKPDNALFKAYFGKALSADTRQQHRAEGELQAAVRMEPKNAEIRMLLVEFFLERNMEKRAEGELKRFLDVVPGHRDATAMLARMGSR